MLENDLSDPVMSWLRERGFKPYQGLGPLFSGGVFDVVARRERTLSTVRISPSIDEVSILQAWNCQIFAHECWLCTLGNPSREVLATCEGKGIGVIAFDDGNLTVCQEPKTANPLLCYVEKMIERMSKESPRRRTAGDAWKARFIKLLTRGK